MSRRHRPDHGRLAIPRADITNSSSVLARIRARHWRITLVWADGGYTGRLVDLARDAWRIALTVVRRTDDTTGFTVLPKGWLVERTFAWLMRSRRLARDYEGRTDTAEAMIRWSMTMVMSRDHAERPRTVLRQPASRGQALHLRPYPPRPSPGPAPGRAPQRVADSPSPPRSC
ncbi:transposase [Streptomyces sp. NRRL B-24484]|uniref:transposase n=1 Tax=Streptomyces sp. NRRL B-24484 TaxID=1463833 RepID=UPI00099680BB